ncbi:hypothetical protein E2C01_085455 [Portunus trituberculatus]|uniref:Uncharacterized protein n=1 Tax=Portunus trituberculatus TaxID=210409 RepID=A0A5B7JAI7_PORTR|nr:hypothetical protein [Portunus trituberculatus]
MGFLGDIIATATASPSSSHSSLLTTPPSSPASGVSLNEFLPPHLADLNAAVVAWEGKLVGARLLLITAPVSSAWSSSHWSRLPFLRT